MDPKLLAAIKKLKSKAEGVITSRRPPQNFEPARTPRRVTQRKSRQSWPRLTPPHPDEGGRKKRKRRRRTRKRRRKSRRSRRRRRRRSRRRRRRGGKHSVEVTGPHSSFGASSPKARYCAATGYRDKSCKRFKPAAAPAVSSKPKNYLDAFHNLGIKGGRRRH